MNQQKADSRNAIYIAATIIALAATILASGNIYGQESLPSTDGSQSTPPQPQGEPAVAEQFTFNAMSKPPTSRRLT
jgi:hypothetical protein